MVFAMVLSQRTGEKCDVSRWYERTYEQGAG